MCYEAAPHIIAPSYFEHEEGSDELEILPRIATPGHSSGAPRSGLILVPDVGCYYGDHGDSAEELQHEVIAVEGCDCHILTHRDPCFAHHSCEVERAERE